MSDRVQSQQTSNGAALQQMLDVAQRAAVARFQLYVLDVKVAIFHGARAAAWMATGMTALLLGWLLLLGAATMLVSNELPLWASLACVGASQCALGAVLLALGRAASRVTQVQT